MKLADQIIDPSENEAFNYKKETVYEVKTSTGNGIITFAKQFVGRPYVWGGNSLTDGIDCSHFVWQILTGTFLLINFLFFYSTSTGESYDSITL